MSTISIFYFCMSIRWLVRVFDSVEAPKEGWVPASILDADSGQQQTDKAIYGDRADDAAYRRQYDWVFRQLPPAPPHAQT